MGDEIEHYSNLFKSAEEIAQEIEAIKDILFSFNIENAEEFSKQLSQIQDRATVLGMARLRDFALTVEHMRGLGHDS